MNVKYKFWISYVFCALLVVSCLSGSNNASTQKYRDDSASRIILGSERTGVYLPLLKGKKVAVVANQTSMVDDVHLVDLLISSGVNVTKVFAPEHGFRGEAGPGDKVQSGTDEKTGLKVVSLYGANKRPSNEDLADVEIVVFDIQDVGARFYTYISTLHYVMEACAINEIKVIVLDRPNPNGFCIDGPVLEKEFSSFVGVSPIPVSHGLTVGEYALLVNGEGWLKDEDHCDLEVIELKNYSHDMLYELPVRPSPNLPDIISVYLYPSLCFFEGTNVSVGRGTDKPFHVIGYPEYSNGEIKFTPKEIPGVISNPPYEDVECLGLDLSGDYHQIIKSKSLNIDWLVSMYESYPEKDKFFNNFFDKLAGTDKLRKQILTGVSVSEIRESWKPEIDKYKLLRKKYLLYKD